MNAMRADKLMQKYAKCPKCGNEALGNGEGTLDVDDSTFLRTCKCGWSVEIKEVKEDE